MSTEKSIGKNVVHISRLTPATATLIAILFMFAAEIVLKYLRCFAEALGSLLTQDS